MNKMIKELGEGVVQLSFFEFGSCVYLLTLDDGRRVAIDSSSEDARPEMLNDFRKLGVAPSEIDVLILTHDHWDHVGNNKLFSNAEVFDSENIDDLKIGGMKVFRAPGHTGGDIALLYKKFLFSGDVLFHNGIGRTDFEESFPEKMNDSLALLRGLDYDTLCPGHV